VALETEAARRRDNCRRKRRPSLSGCCFSNLLIGLAVQRLRGDGNSVARLTLRRTHFVTVLVIAALALPHMLLN
jgi:hypothetical protein